MVSLIALAGFDQGPVRLAGAPLEREDTRLRLQFRPAAYVAVPGVDTFPPRRPGLAPRRRPLFAKLVSGFLPRPRPSDVSEFRAIPAASELTNLPECQST